MSSLTYQTKTATVIITGAYYTVLLMFLIAAFFPQYRVWGFNWWAYYPVWVPFLLFAVGAVTPLLRLVPESKTPEEKLGRYFLFVAGLIVVFGLAFYFLRARTHFLGDGYQILSILASDNPFIKPTERGEALIHLWINSLIGGERETSALLSYQIVSISAGLVFLTVVSLIAGSLFERTKDRILFLLGLASSGYMLLFFGYVENYSLFVLSVAAYSLMGLLIVTGKINRLLILPMLALAIFFHVLGVTLIPSGIYLLVARTKLGNAIGRLNLRTKLLATVFIAAIVLLVFYYYFLTDYFFRFAIVPLFENRFTVEGYTLFSLKHIADYLNLLILFLPGLPIVIAALFFLPVRQIFKQREYRYLLILLGSTLGAVFMFDPKLGMPRDWDLFAFAGVTLVLFVYHLVLDASFLISPRRYTCILLIVLGCFSLFPRVMCQVVAGISIDHFRHYAGMDRIKNRTSRPTLIKYYSEAGENEKAQLEAKRLEADFPETRLRDSAFGLVNTNPQEAAVLCRRVLETNPLYSDAWANLGTCYLHLGDYDHALELLEIADGLNPYNPTFLNNLGGAYMHVGDFKKAEKVLKRALDLDTTNIWSLLNLIKCYTLSSDRDKYYRSFSRLLSRPEASAEHFRTIADSHLRNGDYKRAAEGYHVALLKGLDSAYVKKLAETFPQLWRLLQDIDSSSLFESQR